MCVCVCLLSEDKIENYDGLNFLRRMIIFSTKTSHIKNCVTSTSYLQMRKRGKISQVRDGCNLNGEQTYVKRIYLPRRIVRERRQGRTGLGWMRSSYLSLLWKRYQRSRM